MHDRREQHAAGTTCGVVDGLAFFRVEDFDHQAHHAARGVELARLLVGGVRELLDQVLEQFIRQAILVGPLRIAEHAIQVLLVGRFDAAHSVGQRRVDVLRGSTHGIPVTTVWHLEAVLVGEVLAVLPQHRGAFFVPRIADAFEEEQRQDVRLPVSAIDGAAAENVGGFPKVRLELGERNGERRRLGAAHS